MTRIAVVSMSAFAMFALGLFVSSRNPVHAGDPQFAQCLAQSTNDYAGGADFGAMSRTFKVAASCACVWNETPADFKGRPGSFAGTPRRAATHHKCGEIYRREVASG